MASEKHLTIGRQGYGTTIEQIILQTIGQGVQTRTNVLPAIRHPQLYQPRVSGQPQMTKLIFQHTHHGVTGQIPIEMHGDETVFFFTEQVQATTIGTRPNASLRIPKYTIDVIIVQFPVIYRVGRDLISSCRITFPGDTQHAIGAGSNPLLVTIALNQLCKHGIILWKNLREIQLKGATIGHAHKHSRTGSQPQIALLVLKQTIYAPVSHPSLAGVMRHLFSGRGGHVYFINTIIIYSHPDMPRRRRLHKTHHRRKFVAVAKLNPLLVIGKLTCRPIKHSKAVSAGTYPQNVLIVRH